MTASAIGREWAKVRLRDPYRPSQEDRELISYVEQQVETCEFTKRSQLRDAALALAFVAGRQRVVWEPSTTGGYLRDVKLEEWESDIQINEIRPIVEAQAAKSTENRPMMSVLPATDEEDDSAAARVCDKLLEWVWYERKMQRRIYEFAKSVYIFGLGIFKVWWDPTRGELLQPRAPERPSLAFLESDLTGGTAAPLLPSGEPGDDILTPLLEGLYPQEDVPAELADYAEPTAPAPSRTGAVRIEALTPFEVGIDPGAADIEDAQWAYHLCSMHRDEVATKWPNGKYCRPDHSLSGDPWSTQHLALLRNDGTALRQRAVEDRIKVVEYFERPSPRHPDGRYAVVGGGVLLDQREELPTGDLPFIIARHRSIPRRLHGDGTVKDLIPLNDELNTQEQTDIGVSRLMSDPKWLVAKGSLVNGEIMGGMAGELVEYDPNLPPPRAVAPPPYSPIHRDIGSRMVQYMRDISQVGDIVFGTMPAGMSGRAIGFSQDQMASTLGPTVRELEMAIEGVASRTLAFYRDRGPDDLLIRLVGAGNRSEVHTFRKTDVRSIDVRVVPNSMLPKHLNYRREQLLMMFGQGLFGNPQDPRVQMEVRKAMEFGDMDVAVGDRTAERKYAKEINTLLLGGQVVIPLPEDQHETHIDELNTLRTSDALRQPDYQQVAPLVRWKLAWHYWFLAMIGAGHAWWTLQAQAYPTMPGAPVQPGPVPQPGPPSTTPPPPDAFGPEPPVGPPPAEPAVPPEVLMALASQAAGAGTAPEVVPELGRAFGTDQPLGTGGFDALGQ